MIVNGSASPASRAFDTALRRIAAASRRGDWSGAAALLERARPLARDGRDLVRLHVAAAELRNLMAEREAARTEAEAALRLLETLPTEAGLAARAEAELGTAQWFVLQDPAAAEPHYRRASALLERAPEIGIERRLQILGDFALCLQNTGRTDEAAALYAEVGRRAGEAGLHGSARRARRRSGTLLTDTGNYGDAEAALLSARPPSRATVGERFDWHHAMALLAEKTNRFRLAERHYDEAVAAFEADPHANADRVGGLVNAAILKLMLGWTDVASYLLDLAERSASAAPPASFAFSYPAARAALLAETGALDAGVALMAAAARAAVAGFPDQHGYHLAFHIYGAELLIAADRAEAAAKLLRAALDAISPDPAALPAEALLAGFILAETELGHLSGGPATEAMLRHAGRLALAGVGAEGTWRALAALADFAAMGGDARRAIGYGKLAVMRGSQWALASGMRSLDQPAGPSRLYRVLERLTGRLADSHRLVEARACRNLLRDLTAAGGGRAWVLALTDAELAIEAEVEAAIAALSAKPARMVEGTPLHAFDALLTRERRPATATARAFARAAGGPEPGTAILRYYPEATPPLVEIETAQTQQALVLPLAGAQVTALAGEMVDQVLAGGAWQAASQALHGALLAPLAPYLGGVDTLEIVPGPLLAELPFAALGDGGPMLAERYALAFRSGVAGRMRVPGPARIAGFGASRAVDGAERLRAVPEELARIRAAFPDAVRRSGHRFTRAALAEALAGGSSVVHIASHFQLVPGSAQRSQLYLGAGEPLSVAEFTTQFDWSGVDLVFLSVCETGTSDRLFDGSRTLAATLNAAGVLALVASQWLVADDASVALVDGFYRALKAGRSPARALAEAQGLLMRARMASPALAASGLGARGAQPGDPRHWAGYRVMVAGE